MALQVSSVESKNASAFVTAVNALIGPLLSHNIRRVEFYPGQSLQKFGDDFKFDVTYDTTGSVITNPYLLATFIGNTLATAVAAAQAYITANPTYFFSSIYCLVSSPGTSRTASNVVCLIYNASAVNGAANWAAGGAGVLIGGTIALNQVAYGSGVNTIQGSAGLTYDGTTLTANGPAVINATNGTLVNALSVFTPGMTVGQLVYQALGRSPANGGAFYTLFRYDTTLATQFISTQTFASVGNSAASVVQFDSGGFRVGGGTDPGVGNFVVSGTTSASTSNAGAVVIGNGVAATSVAIGGGKVWAGTRLVGVAESFSTYGIETTAGIGVTNPSTNVNGIYVLSYTRVANTSVSGAHNARALSGSQYGTIAAGQTNSGTWTGFWVENIRNYVATLDTGTLTGLEGGRISFGHFNTDASTPTTTTVTGLSLIGYRSTGTIGTMVGIDIINGSTTIAPTTGYGIRIANVGGTTAFAISTGTGLVSIGDTTDATSSATGAVLNSGGENIAKNLLHRQGRGAGIAINATVAGTITLTNTSREIQAFTGSTAGTIVQFPAANAFGAGIAVLYTINNQSSVVVTPTRAGADTFQGGGTTDPVGAGATTRYASDGVSVWMKI